MAPTLAKLLALSFALAPVLALPSRHQGQVDEYGRTKHNLDIGRGTYKYNGNKGGPEHEYGPLSSRHHGKYRYGPREGKPAPPPSCDDDDETAQDQLVLPLSEGTAADGTLPTPESLGLTLQIVALGLGTQNYTCPNTTTAPIAVGARARLFIAESYLLDADLADSDIPAAYLKAYEYQDCNCGDPDDLTNFKCEDRGNINELPVVGKHYFNAAGTPVFDLSDANEPLLLAGKKSGGIPAPETAYVGESGDGAVDWLFLEDNDQGVSFGVSAVYRVQTAGGSPSVDRCANEGAGEFEVPYTAEYWFYE